MKVNWIIEPNCHGLVDQFPFMLHPNLDYELYGRLQEKLVKSSAWWAANSLEPGHCMRMTVGRNEFVILKTEQDVALFLLRWEGCDA